MLKLPHIILPRVPQFQLNGSEVKVTLGCVNLNFDIPLSAKFCSGGWELGRTGREARQDNGTLKSKSTQPRSETTSVTLYCNWELAATCLNVLSFFG